nr:PREDICTED: uncharacterized protein LOC105669192 isoform X4 [Linepithema humile]
MSIMTQWRQETILKLINAYRERRFLWDNTVSEYTDRSKRIDAWKEIANENPAPASSWKSQEISTQNRDEFTVFAEHVAIRLKNITDVRARLVAQHQINNILFEAEMGKYNMQSSYNSTHIMEHLDEPSTSNEEKVIIKMSQTMFTDFCIAVIYYYTVIKITVFSRYYIHTLF